MITHKRIMLFCIMCMVAVVGMAADKSGRFFLQLQGQQIPAKNVVDYFPKWFSLPAGTTWEEVSSTVDITGMDRIVYSQYVNGVKVDHSQVIVHAQEGIVRSANGMVMEEANRPARRPARVAVKNGATTTEDGRELLLVSTSSGYRYAYKVFAAPTQEWVYYDAETDKVIKRVATVHRMSEPEGTPVTVTGQSIFSGQVQVEANKGTDGVTYLYDAKRNVHTFNASAQRSIGELANDGDLFKYFPQGNLPDNLEDVTLEQRLDWMKIIDEMMLNNQLEKFGDYIKNGSFYVSSPDGNFSAYRVNTLELKTLNLSTELAACLSGLIDGVQAGLFLDIVYGANAENPSHGYIEHLQISSEMLYYPLPLTNYVKVIPKEGVTIVLKAIVMYRDSGETETVLLSSASFVPDATGTFNYSNENVAFTVTYEPFGDPAVDVHWGMCKTLDFYDEVFSRKSFDGKGSPVYNFVYLNEMNEDLLGISGNQAAAISRQSPYPMLYGMGSLTYGSKPVVELSVLAHEFTHIITGMTAKLESYGEAGALNESFSDIMGISAKKYVLNNEDWCLAKDVQFNLSNGILLSNLRDMAAPKNSQDGLSPLPDTYKGEYWKEAENLFEDNGGVHTNCGVQNKWYYLLTEGGTGTNSNGYEYSVQGIGIDKSRQIAYLTLTSYATEQSDYPAISEASMEAARVLYGNGAEVNAVIDAWKAVGVLDEDYTDAITQVKQEISAGTRYYDLQGRQMDELSSKPGIYIQSNGKKPRKVVVR